MGSLIDTTSDTKHIKERYSRKIIVYLEGDDDVAFYKNYWFNNLLSKIDFFPAEEGPSRLSGCNGVYKNVSIDRLAGVNAYGISDRDALISRALDLANEAKDAVYLNAIQKKFPHQHFTLYWELENYLIDPKSLEEERADATNLGTTRPLSDVIHELCLHCITTIPHAAYNSFLQSKGQCKIGDGATNPHPDRHAVQAFVDSRILKPEDTAEYSRHLADVEAFDLPKADDSARLAAIRRRIHGKAVLFRFRHVHNMGNSEIRFRLARKLSTSPPADVAQKLQHWITTR